MIAEIVWVSILALGGWTIYLYIRDQKERHCCVDHCVRDGIPSKPCSICGKRSAYCREHRDFMSKDMAYCEFCGAIFCTTHIDSSFLNPVEGRYIGYWEIDEDTADVACPRCGRGPVREYKGD